MRRLSELERVGAARRRRVRGVPPGSFYELTPFGGRLLSLVQRAGAWEAPPRRPGGSPAGALALEALADQRSRAILCGLAGGPMGVRELARAGPRYGVQSHGSLMRRIALLHREGLLLRSTGASGVRYELDARSRRLAMLIVLAMHAESAGGPLAATAAEDLVEALGLLAPAVGTPASTRGAYSLYVSAPGGHGRALWVGARDGRLRVLPGEPDGGLAGLASAPVQQWLTALARGRLFGIRAAGDLRGLSAIVGGLCAPAAAPQAGGRLALVC
jgi:DNA-binding HxlR family transcriptional regulator